MKIILSVEPVKFPLTGVGRYTYELARNLDAVQDIELRYFAGTDFVPELPSPSQPPPSGPVSAITSVKRVLARNPLLLDLHRALVNRRRRRALKGTADAVYHGTNFYLPPVEGPAVVTIHDISVFTLPECHPVERVRFMRKEVALSLERTTSIITVSEHARQEVIRYFGFPAERISAIPLASSGDFTPRRPDQVDAALRRYGLAPDGYTLYAGTIEPRKNLLRLLEAYGKLNPALRRRRPLVLAGYKGWNNDAIMDAIRRAESEGWARYLGFVPDEVLPDLFAGARLFTFPSLYEGFGLPVLEAMASGIPVVCSNSSSLPEVVGDAAAICAPEDVGRLSDLIARGLEDEAWRAEAIRRGLDRAASFSWLKCAEQTAKVYRAALDLAA